MNAGRKSKDRNPFDDKDMTDEEGVAWIKNMEATAIFPKEFIIVFPGMECGEAEPAKSIGAQANMGVKQ